jgi:indolepyruvate ferredoxin oxidoreductase beta subunit
MNAQRPLKIAVMALGGQGGGVLAEWIVKTGERAGFIAQSTSVPGVAQRTGATIYYVELFPQALADARGKAPVLALMPAPGDVDIVIASELMEAGRALARGFMTDRTTLIASTHRVLAIGEKIRMGDGRRDAEPVRAAAQAAAGTCIWFDMEATSDKAGAAISAVMLGALAGSGATAIPRALFEGAIREGGRAVEKNLAAFDAGYAAAAAPAIKGSAPAPAEPAAAVDPLAALLAEFPGGAQPTLREGLKRTIDYQDRKYGALYLERAQRFLALDGACGGEARRFELTREMAKHLALAMTYEDVVRVADLKTRRSRFERVRHDVRAEAGQIVRVREYMHPRVEEACDLAPAPLARLILGSKTLSGLVNRALGGGRRVATTDISGFLLLSGLAALRPLRRASSRFRRENGRIEAWLALIDETAQRDYAAACEIARLQRLLKGYGETYERGLKNFHRIVAALGFVMVSASPAASLARLKDCALADENGSALDAELSRLGVDDPIAA